MIIQSIMFRRTQDGPWEHGIIINGDRLIVGIDAKPIPDKPQIWNWKETTYLHIEIELPGEPK